MDRSTTQTTTYAAASGQDRTSFNRRVEMVLREQNRLRDRKAYSSYQVQPKRATQ